MKSKENPDKILRNYKVYLKLEKSLSDNTVNAYLADIHKLY
jgi:integrase/recombinase XerD